MKRFLKSWQFLLAVNGEQGKQCGKAEATTRLLAFIFAYGGEGGGKLNQNQPRFMEMVHGLGIRVASLFPLLAKVMLRTKMILLEDFLFLVSPLSLLFFI